MRRVPAWCVLGVGAIVAGALAGCGSGGGGSPGATNPHTVHLLTTSIPAATTGVEYAADFEAEVPHGPGSFYVGAGTLPVGLQLDRTTGALRGYPRQVGSFHFDVVVRDGVDFGLPPSRDATFAEDRRGFTVVVSRGPPRILPQLVPGAQYRASYAYQIDVAGGTAPFTFAQTGGTLPAGMSVTSTGEIGYFPTEAQPTPYAFSVTVTDATGQTDTANLSLLVVVPPLILATSNPIPQAAAGFAYDLTLVLATPGGGQPYTWTQAPLAPGETDLFTIGMQISPDGHLKDFFGGPTSTGTFLFTVQVTDEPGQLASRQLELTVNPGPVLTSVTPNRGTSSPPYTLTGLNFQPGVQVVVKPGATQVVVAPVFVDATTLTIHTAMPKPVGAGGAVPIQVVNPDGGSFTKPAAFIFPATTVAYGGKGFFSSNLSSTGLAAADVDLDGRADVVHAGAAGLTPFGGSASSTTGGLLYHRNLGGTPVAFSTVSLDTGNYYDVKFVDVNLDGTLDVLALGQTSLRVWLNGVGGNPLGTFTSGPISALPAGFSWPSEMAVGRIDAGAVPDVVFGVPHYPTQNFNGRVYSMVGSGNGAFTPLDSAISTIVNTHGVNALACVDTDNNGQSEVAAGVGMNPSSGPVLNYASVSGSGFFNTWTSLGGTVGPPYYASTTGMAVGDFLGTGQANQVVALMSGSPNYSSFRVIKLFSGVGLSSVTNLTTVPSTTGKSVSAVDADFDTRMDFAVTVHPSTITVYSGLTLNPTVSLDASTGSPTITAPLTGRVAMGDVDGDGRPDVLATTSYWAVNSMAANYGTTYTMGTCGDGGSRGVVFFLNASN